MNSMKWQKGMTLKDESPQVPNMLLEKSGEITPERMQSILKEISPECSLEGLMLKLKL